MQTPIRPAGMESFTDDFQMSPGLKANGFLFLTGMSGASPDLKVDPDPETQFVQAFSQVEQVLTEAGLDFGALVEITSYHVGLRSHLDLFRTVKARYVPAPYPAWTAIEVSGFVTDGVIIELRCIAALP